MINWIVNGFHALVADIINGVLGFLFSIITSVEVTPFHPEDLPGFTPFLIAIQSVSTAFLLLVFLKEWMINEFESLADTGVNPLSYIKNNIIAGVLIWVTPALVTQIILPFAGYVSDMISAKGSFGSPAAMSHDMVNDLTLDAKSVVAHALLKAIFPELNFWSAVLIVIVFLIAVIIVGISSGRRWMELFTLIVIGPVLALSKASYGGLWDAWLRQTITAAFSQAVQYFSITLAFNMFLNSDSVDAVAGGMSPQAHIFLAIGAAIFAATGPGYLRNLLMGQASSGFRAAQSLASTAMMIAK